MLSNSLNKLNSYIKKLNSKITTFWWLFFVLAASWTLQLINITRSSIWHDEGFTVMLIERFDFLEIIYRTGRDVHPPLHYLLLKPWAEFFGSSELALRSFSVVFMLAAIATAFFVLRRLFGEATARMSSVFLVLAPFIIRYGQEARMYALVVFLLMLCTYFVVRLFEQESKPHKFWIGYGVSLALALYTHYYALFLVPVFWLFALHTAHRKNNLVEIFGFKAAWMHIKALPARWWNANILAGILFLPWLPIAYRQFTQVQSGFWIPPVNHNTLFNTLGNFLAFTEGGPVSPWVSTLIMIAVPAVLVLAYQAYKQNPEIRSKLLLLYAYAALPPITIYILSLPPLQSVYTDRYFALTAIFFYAALGLLVMLNPLKRKLTQRYVVAGMLVLLLSIGVSRVYSWGSFNMRELMAPINNQATEKDMIISAELYTYFETWYYTENREQLKLLKSEMPSYFFEGYGNASLIYDQEELLLEDIEAVNESRPEFVWIVGQDSTFELLEIPTNWQLVDTQSIGYATYQKYLVSSSGDQSVTINQ